MESELKILRLAGLRLSSVLTEFDLYRSTTTDAAGKYQINAIPPGSYKVFVWEDIEPQSWYDNSLIRSYEDLGKALTIVDASAQTVDMIATSPFER